MRKREMHRKKYSLAKEQRRGRKKETRAKKIKKREKRDGNNYKL